jgi:hypothetical protein
VGEGEGEMGWGREREKERGRGLGIYCQCPIIAICKVHTMVSFTILMKGKFPSFRKRPRREGRSRTTMHENIFVLYIYFINVNRAKQVANRAKRLRPRNTRAQTHIKKGGARGQGQPNT